MLNYKFKKNPIIFIPGLFGSMSNVIIPGTGNWSFGGASFIYDPFIQLLESIGYQRNKNLFTCFYDWSQRISHSAQRYLIPKIEEIKLKTGYNKVNLVCHSMGGLVARSYIQSEQYLYDVDKLILLCTPNAGSAPNYSFWTRGKAPVKSSLEFNIVYNAMEMYIRYLSTRYRLDRIQAVHTYFKGLQDVIPGRDYGDYLLIENHHSKEFIPYQTMKMKNKFLDELNRHKSIIKNRGIDVTLIGGYEKDTNLYLKVIPTMSPNIEGEVESVLKTNMGDGNVVLNSLLSLDGDKYILQGDHVEVLYKSGPILREKLQ
ncbi:lipase/acyltransferase domain-containing protein [Priestia sp. JNUCC 25]